MSPRTLIATLTLRFGPEHAIDKDCFTDKLKDPVALQKRGFTTVADNTQWIRALQRTTLHGEAAASQPTLADPYLMQKCTGTWCTSVRLDLASHRQLGGLDRCQRYLDEG